MTLPLNSRLSALYDTNGTQKDFSFGFRVFFDPDNGGYGLEVRRQTADGYEVIPKSDYLVLPVEDNSAGVVRFSVAPSAGQQIYIAGKTPTIQQLVLTNFGRYSAESIETQFDFITAIIQEWLSALDEETRQRMAADDILTQYVVNRIDAFVQQVNQNFDDKSQEIEDYIATIMPSFTQTLREEIEAFAVAGMQGAIDQTLAESKAEIDDAVARANAAALAAAITGKVYDTPEAGVDPVTGVQNGAYYNVRSLDDDSYLVEYQNLGGVPTPTGKSYPSSSYVQEIADYTAMPFIDGNTYNAGDRVTLDSWATAISIVPNNTGNPNDSLNNWKIVDNFKRIDLSSFKLSKDSDITTLLSYMLSLSIFSPIEIILPYGEFLLSGTARTPNESLGVILDLNGSTLRPKADANLMDNYTGQRYIVSLASNTEHPAVIKNGVLDGVLRDQNLFADTDYENSISVKRTDGVVLRGKHVAMQNLTVKNQFGVVSRFIGCNTIDVSDVIYENVGGLTAYGDIFLGDMFYIEMGAAGQESIQANFTNVNAIGKRSDQYPSNTMPTMFTRTGITLEGFAEQVVSNIQINVANCNFKNVQRWLHAETPQTVNVRIDNSEIGSVLMLAGWNLNRLHADVSSSSIELYEGWYNNSYKGLGAAIGQASVSVTLDSCTVSHVGSDNREAFGTWCTTKATNTKFNIYGKWAAHTHITLDKCIIAVFGNLATSNLTVGGSLKFTDTEVFYSGSYIEVWEGTENYYLKQCAFHNIDFDVGVTRNIEKLDDCRLVLTDTTKVKNKFWKYMDTYGFVLQYPKYFWGLSKSTLVDNKYTRDTYQKAGGSVSILAPWVVNLFNRYGLLLMVAKGCENTTHLLDTIGTPPGGWSGYIVALASYNPFSDTYSFLTPRIYCGLTYEEGVKGITVDDNFVITNFGTTVNFAEVAFVPYCEISSLPYVPPQLLTPTTP